MSAPFATTDPAPVSEPMELPLPDREVFDGIEANISLARNLMIATPDELRQFANVLSGTGGLADHLATVNTAAEWLVEWGAIIRAAHDRLADALETKGNA